MSKPVAIADVVRTVRSLEPGDPTAVEPDVFDRVVSAVRNSGGVLALVGPSAAGKSTALALAVDTASVEPASITSFNCKDAADRARLAG